MASWVCRSIWSVFLLAVTGLVVGCTTNVQGPGTSLAPEPSPLPRPASPEPPRHRSASQLRVDAVDGLDLTGASDASAALQAIIDASPDGSHIVLPHGARLRLDVGLVVDGRRDIILDGNDATLVTDGCGRESSLISVGLLEPSTDITIQGIQMEGGNDRAGTPDAFDGDCQFQAGIALYGASRVEIHDIEMSGMRGDCLYVGIARSGTWTTDVTYRDSSCIANGRQAVSVVAGERISTQRVSMDQLAMHALDIEPNDGSGGARDVLFLDNEIGTYGHSDAYTGFFFGANGSLDAPVDRVLVSGNVVTGGSLRTSVGDEYTGWDGQRTRRSIEVSDNTSQQEAIGPVLTFKHVDGLRVSGNTQPLSAGPLVRLDDVTDAIVAQP